MLVKQNQNHVSDGTKKQRESIYMLACLTTILVIIGSLLDIFISFTLGGDLSGLPITAVDRFSQFHGNWLLGLYNLDMLNLVTTVLMIPTYLAVHIAHRRVNNAYVKLAMATFVIGATVFIANNTALPMLELSKSYYVSTIETQRTLFAAAGEAMLARGAHGSPGAFLGFVLSSIASIVMSVGLLKGGIFSKATAYIGISGGILLLVYLILVTFAPEIKAIAMMVATPGGLLSIAWLVMVAVQLFMLWRNEDIG